MPFKFDKQTISWLNGIKYNWREQNLMMGGGIAEGGSLPLNIRPIINIYRDPISQKDYPYYNHDGWGEFSWHHTPNLVDNECRCDKCLGIGDEFDEYNIIKQKIERKKFVKKSRERRKT